MSRTALMRVDQAAVEASAAELGDVIERMFAPLTKMAGALAAAWDGASGSPYGTGELMELQGIIFDSLDVVSEYDSAGYVMYPGILSDRDQYLEWWHRTDQSSFQPLILNLDPSSPDHYDYFNMEWFVAAREEARRFVSGPLIDLPCAESHILTFSQPAVWQDRLLGIAGADVAMSRLEMLIVPPLRRLQGPAVLVNGNRRVVAAGDARWAAGDKLRTMPSAGDPAWQTVAPVTPDQGWVLAVAAP